MSKTSGKLAGQSAREKIQPMKGLTTDSSSQLGDQKQKLVSK
jgi:hypothetical protein